MSAKRAQKKAAAKKTARRQVTLKAAKKAALIVRLKHGAPKVAAAKKGGPAWERVLGHFGAHSR